MGELLRLYGATRDPSVQRGRNSTATQSQSGNFLAGPFSSRPPSFWSLHFDRVATKETTGQTVAWHNHSLVDLLAVGPTQLQFDHPLNSVGGAQPRPNVTQRHGNPRLARRRAGCGFDQCKSLLEFRLDRFLYRRWFQARIRFKHRIDEELDVTWRGNRKAQTERHSRRQTTANST